MLFTDISFIFVFLPVSLLVFYISNEKIKPYILLFLNLLFYACGTVDFFVILCIITLFILVVGNLIQKYKSTLSLSLVKILLFIGIIIILMILSFFKYSGFFFAKYPEFQESALFGFSLIQPIGLSFYSFKVISYLVDVYRGKTSSDYLSGVNYLLFFGQIQSGPISRYESFNNTGVLRKYIDGSIERFIVGLGKKVLLANTLSLITTEIFNSDITVSSFMAWTGSICFSLQLYYDFSGYSDMAIGISGMFGIECPENFNYPYMTRTISEFWRRWHITLGSWFRDYVYIPLGGSRCSKLRIIINLFVVWILTGIWHGNSANFIFWGLSYFVLISIEKNINIEKFLENRIIRNIYRVVSLFIINFLWVIFYFNKLKMGLKWIKAMIIPSVNSAATNRAIFLIKDYWIFIAMGILFTIPVIPIIEEKISDNRKIKLLYSIGFYLGILSILVLSLGMIISGQNNPFLYTGF